MMDRSGASRLVSCLVVVAAALGQALPVTGVSARAAPAVPAVTVEAPTTGSDLPIGGQATVRFSVVGAPGAHRAGQPYGNFPFILQFNTPGQRRSAGSAPGAPSSIQIRTDAQGRFAATYPAPSTPGTYDLVIYPNYAGREYG